MADLIPIPTEAEQVKELLHVFVRMHGAIRYLGGQLREISEWIEKEKKRGKTAQIDSQKFQAWTERQLRVIHTLFSEIDMSQVATIVNAASAALQAEPVVPVGGAIIDPTDVAAINAMAALPNVNQSPIPASQIQQAPATSGSTTGGTTSGQ
jgi:hypothetical protein